ncbi:MAG: hypothetical protein QOF02_843 [Blastocatellia bacterium]|nr:hypothetical protein [Blastocatellia bacterium]
MPSRKSSGIAGQNEQGEGLEDESIDSSSIFFDYEL